MQINEKHFWKATTIGLLVFSLGLVLLFFFGDYRDKSLWINVGCSLLASSLVILITEIFEKKPKDPLEGWGVADFYESRKLMNIDTDKALHAAKKTIDVIGFGLRSFRDEKNATTDKLLLKGINIRILTMHPESKFIQEREKEEKVGTGHIKNSIEQLIKWADQKNQNKKNKGKIIIKGYNCMTLDFYWRVDDVIYIGPYLYGMESQNMISYKFANGKAYDMYREYFERLWEDDALSSVLTANTGKRGRAN